MAAAAIAAIPLSLLHWSRRRSVTPGTTLTNPFVLPQHPPGVGPQTETAIAQDEQPQVNNSFAWAASNAIYSAYAEGLVFLGFAYLATLSQRPEYRVVTETIASEMTREWVEFKSVSADKGKADRIKEMQKADRDYGIQELFRKTTEGDGFFGRGHIFIDNGEEGADLKSEIGDGRNSTSRSKIGKRTKLSFRSIEAMWCYPTAYNSNDPLRPDWYKPQRWFVMANEVHRTRLLTLVSREMPDLLKPAYSFGGLSLSQMLKPYVDNWLRTRQSVSDMVHSFAVWVLKTNFMQRLGLGGNDLENRVELFNNIRDNHGTAVIDKESEEIENVSAPLGGLSDLQAQAQEQPAAIAQIPLVKYLGLQAKGLNSSSEGEIRVFYDRIHANQERLFRKPLNTIYGFIQLKLWGEIDDDITFDFVSLWQLDDAGKAAIQLTKAQVREVDIASGVISPEEGREAAAADPDSQYAGLDLDKEPAPGEASEEEELAGSFGGAGAEGGAESGKPPLGGAQPHATNRLASSITSRAANFGGAATGGFGSDAGTSAGARKAWLDRERAKEKPAAAPRVTAAERMVSMPDRASWPDHVKAMKVPPAWTDVRVSADPEAPLQVVGRDAKGRAQYLYGKQFADSQTAKKFQRVMVINDRLPAILTQNAKDIRSADASTREHAEVTGLIIEMGLRPGGERETGGDVKAFGATTLRPEHVIADGDETRLVFVGKKGVKIDQPVLDKGLAEMLRRRKASAQLKARGKEDGGQLFPGVTDGSLRRYVKKLAGGLDVKTKDLRTLKATRMANDLVSQDEAPNSMAEYKRRVMRVAKAVSQKLGNTPAVALASYISPVVFAPWLAKLTS